MIKKLFLGLGLSVLSFIGFSSAGVVRQIGTISTSPYNNNVDINVLKYGSFLSNFLGYGKPILYLSDDYVWFWHYNTNLGFNSMYSIVPGRQGFVSRYAICNELTGGSNTNVTQTCGSAYDITTETKDFFYNFFSTVTTDDYYFVHVNEGTNTKYSSLCISSHTIGKSICFGNCYYGSNNCAVLGYNGIHHTFDSLGYSGVFAYINTSGIGSSPGAPINNNSSSDGGIELLSDYSALNYYEKHYGWDKSICYVGVDNVTSLYGQNGVSFQQGKGLSIFDTYDLLYGSGDLEHYYVWLNTWLLNYEQRFNRDGNPLYLANYNTGLNQVDLYYDNLTFPFSNNPVAFYFMADNIVNQSPESTMGSSVVSYCNIKINSGTFDDIIDQADKNNIIDYSEQYNTTHGLNADGSSKEYGAFLGSGVDIAFSGNVTVKNTLKNFFEEFEKVVNVGTGSSETTISNTAILPKWLIVAFLFVVLFKFLRKR